MNREKNLQHAFTLNCLEIHEENQRDVQTLLLPRLYVSCARFENWGYCCLFIPLNCNKTKKNLL